MKAQPGNFYLGVIDVFSIMLPGALLAYFLPELVDISNLGKLFQQPKESLHEWLIFLFPAYLFGHIAFLVSSFIDIPYDNRIRPCFYPEINELEYAAAEVIQARTIGEDNAKAINTFQWAKALMVLESPEASAEVARLEAASKFFRSLVVVFAILAILNIVAILNAVPEKGSGYAVLVLLILMLLSLWRYAERRHKSVKQACWFVITKDGISQKNTINKQAPRKPTHAGGVVYRMINDEVKYLLVRPKQASDEWLFPKGHIEEGELPTETAIREVREESGFEAQIIARVGSIQFRAKGEDVYCDFFLMQYVGEVEADDKRNPTWYSPGKAMRRLSFANYKHLLILAEQKRANIESSDKKLAGVKKGTKINRWLKSSLNKLKCLLSGK